MKALAQPNDIWMEWSCSLRKTLRSNMTILIYIIYLPAWQLGLPTQCRVWCHLWLIAEDSLLHSYWPKLIKSRVWPRLSKSTFNKAVSTFFIDTKPYLEVILLKTSIENYFGLTNLYFFFLQYFPGYFE